MRFERPGALLDEPGFDASCRLQSPGEDQGDGVELPRPVHAARVAVDVVGDAVFADEVACLFPAPRQFADAEGVQPLNEGLPVRPHRPGGDHFVIEAGRGGVPVWKAVGRCVRHPDRHYSGFPCGRREESGPRWIVNDGGDSV